MSKDARSLPRKSGGIFDHYKCPQNVPPFVVSDDTGEEAGYFRCGPEIVCYGQMAGGASPSVGSHLVDALDHIHGSMDSFVLPFDPDQVIDNLTCERYRARSEADRWIERSRAKTFYYTMRPFLPRSVRKRLQRIYFRGWSDLLFPAWPVDLSVDHLRERLLALAMKRMGVDRLPFIWFWPQGHQACALMTHDIETEVGRDFCGRLMEVDEEFGIPAAFQIVPESRYEVSSDFVNEIRTRGFEVNVHGLDHEGDLFMSRETFLEQAKQINRYAERFGSKGFRSPSMYRNADWLHELNFSYDMSVPNVARLEAQRGGCCTVMPFFLPGGMLELPLTTTEDYSLFEVLGEYSTRLWEQQMDSILEVNGMISFVVHPDYVVGDRALGVYKSLLAVLNQKRQERDIWITLPRDVDRWWRERREMKLVKTNGRWTIEGVGSERACVAYACASGDELVYELESIPTRQGLQGLMA